jgi:hypothetical protein
VRATLVGQHDTWNHGARRLEAARGLSASGSGAGHALVQRVRVEEAGAVERRRGRDDVVERALDLVGVAHVAGCQQQPPGELHGGHAGARLRVSAIGRQLEVLAERLVGVARSHAAREVGAGGDRALPLALDRRQQLAVAGLGREVDGAAGEVERAHGVAAEGLRLADRHVVLEVGPAALDVGERRPPAPLDEPPRLLEVALLAGGPVQLDERHLDLRVPAHALVAVVAERVAHVVGCAARDLGEAVLAARAQPRYGGLDHVPVAVELVAPLEVGVAVLEPAVAEARVEVAVVLLGAGHLRGDVSDLAIELGIARPADLPRHRLDHLVDVRVGELAPALAVRVTEVVDPAEPRLPRVAVRNEHLGVELLPRAPETAIEADVGERSQRPAGWSDRFSHGALLT